MLVTLVGHMMAPSIAFTALAQHLTTKGIQTLSLIGGGKPTNLSPSAISVLVESADVVLIGMSAPEELAREETLSALSAELRNTPFGLYADTYDVFRRPWFDKRLKILRENASFLFVPGEKEKEEARKLFPNAEIVASGNPTWEDFFSPRFSREEVRQRLMIRRDEKAVLCSIGTILENNLTMLEALDTALTAEKNRRFFWKVIVGIHPGDQNYRNDPAIYAKSFRANVPMRFVARDEMPTMDIIPGADYVVDTPGSSIGVNAACLLIPVICYCSEAALNELEKSIAKKSWRPCELGVMLPVYSLDKLAGAFNRDFTAMIERQKEVYPAPAQKGQAVRIMAETLQKYGSLK